MTNLALGTAQFGLPYGVANRGGALSHAEAGAVLDVARSCGIDTLDTAAGYGDSEATLGRLKVDDFRVISKLPVLPDDCVDVDGWVLAQLEASLTRLQVSALAGLLLHRPGQLLDSAGDRLYAALLAARQRGLTEKIGISVYEPAELDTLLARFDVDIVQAPLNLLDRRLVETGWAERLAGQGVELHARSCFLQGLLLMPAAERPPRFARFAPLWSNWEGWLADSGLSPLQACLRYSVSQPGVSRVVLGVDGHAQLQEIVAAVEGPELMPPVWSVTPDPMLLNPSMWNRL